jgi:sRNA-binding regulator protein Hfq
VIVIEWQLDFLLPVQSVAITIIVVSSNPTHGRVYSIQHYVIKFVSDPRTLILKSTISCIVP